MDKTIYNEDETIKYYDLNANSWHNSHGRDFSFWTSEIQEFTNLLPSGKILEIGSGAGKEASLLINVGYDYTGVDLSKTLLELAKNKNPKSKFIKASVYKLPFKDKTFDGFWCCATLLHIPETKIDLALTEIKRVTKSGGIGFISLKAGDGEKQDKETGRWFTFYSKKKFSEILAGNGFKILKITSKRQGIWWLSFFVKVL